MEHKFTTFIRTKTLLQRRLKGLTNYDYVKVYIYELDAFNVNRGPVLHRLKQNGEITYDHKGNFRALRDGPIDFTLMEKVKRRRCTVALSPLHLWMRDQLMYVNLDLEEKDLPVYFSTFLRSREKHLDLFFTVDSFSNRVHTPIVNLKADLRYAIRFHNEKVVSLDVKQMQPTILAKVLLNSIGKNPFSDAIYAGEDVYVLLQRVCKLPTRAQAKTCLFKLIFGKPMDDIGSMFGGDNAWIEWINAYKSRVEPLNPHKDKTHTNLAWLLQYSEVQVMTDIWNKLMVVGVPFLTVHDDVLVRVRDKDVTHKIMDEELSKHFKRYKIHIDHEVE